MGMNKQQPHSIEAEKAILSALLLKPDTFYEVSTEIKSTDFYIMPHAEIYSAVSSIMDSTGNYDIVTIQNHLSDNGKLDIVGGFDFLISLTDTIANFSAIKSHCKIVKEKSKLRQIVETSNKALHGVYSGDSFDTVCNGISDSLNVASGDNIEQKEHISKTVNTVVKEVQGKCDGNISQYGIKSGLVDLDNYTGGWQDTDLVIIAGRPGMGKTTVALNAVKYAAEKGKRILFFSLEMSKEKLTQKIISMISGISQKAINRGLLTDNDWPIFTRAAGIVSNLPITIDDSSALHYRDIQSRAKLEYMKNGVDLVVIDYLQLAKGDGENRTNEVMSISGGFKALAKDLKIPVIALSQLNRGLENRPNKRPLMSDLRESGALEQDASVICFIYRDEVYNDSPDNPEKGVAEFIIGKNREGECGTVKTYFDGATSKFTSISKFDEPF